MEKKDLTFIPKKSDSVPVYGSKRTANPAGYSIVLLLVSGLLLAGAYFYKDFLQDRADELIVSVERAQIGAEQSLADEFKIMSGKIDAAKMLFSKHKSLVPIFALLEETTIESVRFLSFNYALSEDGNSEINIEGEAKSYSSLAFQQEVFEKNSDIENVSISGLSLGDDGKINFNVRMAINPSIIIYNPDNNN